MWVHSYLQNRSQELADLVAKMISAIEYKFDRSLKRLPLESEIRITGTAKLERKNAKSKPFIIRSGLPQGLSFSPILATLVLELIPAPKGLIMCADDGVVITKSENMDEFSTWIKTLKTLGVHLEPEKSGIVDNVFKFLGVEFDMKAQTAKFRESTIC